MAKEIERKFIAAMGTMKHDRAKLLESSYLSTADPEVRVARYVGEEGSYQITAKQGSGLVREEIVVPIPDSVGEALMKLGVGRRIVKTRYNAGRWEVDKYNAELSGLTIAEIELTNRDEPLPVLPKGLILLSEVTLDPRFKNKALASAHIDMIQSLLREARLRGRS